MNFKRLASLLKEWGEPVFRLKQAKRAFFVEGAASWDEVSVFAKPLREKCAENLPWNALTVITEEGEGDTNKILFSCADGSKIESVLIKHEDGRRTVCVSSQVGCPMGCAFCATGTMGFKRNLSAEEIVEQVVWFMRELKPKEERVSNVVFMGMGEPFHNYDAVLEAVRTMNDLEALGIGARRISISTCGIVPGILRLADEPLQVNLAISLHGATDAVRSRLMPVNAIYPIEKLMKAVSTYMEKSNRQVMFEYLLIEGMNDQRSDAEALAHLLRPYLRLAHVNLIKYHPTEAFRPSDRETRIAFLERLQDLGVSATYRVSFGEEVEAACGQLAVREEKGKVYRGVKAAAIGRRKRSGS